MDPVPPPAGPPSAEVSRGPGAVAWVFGFLSLVPFLGVFFAVVAVTLGIVKWKREGWKIILLGVAGLLVTAGLSGYIVHRFLNPGTLLPDKVYRQSTQENINACLKAIEYYRQTEGRYPADLQEIFLKDKKTIVFDMMAMKNYRDPVYFVYDVSPSGDTYYLFARGEDREAYTADDILPQVTAEEMGNLGYRERPTDFSGLAASPVPSNGASAASSGPAPTSITWMHPGEEEKEAERTGKPILYDFTAAWCPPCRRLNEAVFEDPEYGKRIAASFVTVKVLDRRREEGKNPPEVDKLQRAYPLRGFPTLVVKKKDGTSDSIVGFRGLTGTIQFLEKNGMK